jgi:hypothetical protein
MKKYLLIESRGEYESAGARDFLEMALTLKRQGAAVEVMLVHNGVIAARTGARAGGLAGLLAQGVIVMADDFSLRERALAPSSLMHGIEARPLGAIIDRMAEGWNVLWH